jgi:hypothetical protein
MTERTWTSEEELAPGIFVYHDALPNGMEIIKRLEKVLDDPESHYGYAEAMVGYAQKMPEYRDCYDFKYKRTDIDSDQSPTGDELRDIWDVVHNSMVGPVADYCQRFPIGELKYWEANNFIKYGPGQHFQEHTDHGFSYNSTLSAVLYPNDDYEGGELFFRLQGLKVKAKAGDLFLFPSNFMYPHRAMPVESGFKYSIVTMLDYSAKFHTPEMYRETGD